MVRWAAGETLEGMKPSKTEARWRRLIAEQERSGQSVREFAEERELSAWSLYGWRSRLGLSGRRGRAGQSKGAGRRTNEAQLVPVEVVGPATAAGSGSERDFEVELGAGIRVHVPGGFDAEELLRLVSVLRASC